MNIDLLSDINLQISSDVEEYNQKEIKSYDPLSMSIITDAGTSTYLKLHLLDYYSFDNLAIDLTSDSNFETLDVSYSKDNINWVSLDSGITDTSIELAFEEITAAYLKLDFNYLILKDTGYYTFDGVNDKVVCKNNPVLGDTFSICFTLDLNSSTEQLKSVISSTGGATGITVYTNIYNNRKVAVQIGGCAVSSSVGKLPVSGFCKVCLWINRTLQTCDFYFDNVRDTGSTITGVIPVMNYTGMEIGTYSGNYKLRNVVMTNDLIDATDVANYENGLISSIDNQLIWYKFNELVPSGSAPYTYLTVDYSGNANHGTPTNVEANKETFFNPILNITINTIDILVNNILVDSYSEYFKEYKQKEMKDFLSKKLFDGTDIQTIVDNYIEES